ncbi:MAG TPA: right-handed parallel beta-helix repeat-containing protein [Opitutaceae bacterium]|nr:right-handed parallel beta-helix repeat-containing protein [Opitutaceae bacterium]
MHPHPFSLRTLAVALAVSPVLALAQPSGGPYGPQPQTYTPPADAAHVFYVAPDGVESASGATLAEPTTIEAAIARATTGDAIILRGGTYRTGDLKFNQGITLQPHARENPVLKGSLLATGWVPQRNGIWRTKWEHLFPLAPESWWRREREGMRTPLHRFNNDMVFIDGRALQSVGWEGEVDADSFYIDYKSGNVYIGADPAGRTIEITALDNAFTRTIKPVHGRESDRRGPTIRGVTFTQYAYRAIEIEGSEPTGPDDPANYGKDVLGTTLENVTISHCSRAGGYFRGDGLVIRNSLVSDTGTEGLFIHSSSDCLLERNIFTRNNIERITGYYPAAVKIFNQTHRFVCRDNLIIDQPHSNGIWYDVGNRDGVFINNWIEYTLDGFFFEISRGAICAGNVFVNCDKGIRMLNAADVRVYNNTFVNTVASFERTERSAVGDHFDWHPATGPDVDEREGHVFEGNLLLASANFPKALVRFEQTANLCGTLTRPMVAGLDGNVYVRESTSARPLLVWGPLPAEKCVNEFASLGAFRAAVGAFEANSVEIDAAPGAIVRSMDLGNYQLNHALERTAGAPALPEDVRKLLGWSEAEARTVGAYPFGK